MLATRIATALVLLALLLPSIFRFPPLAWGVLTLCFLAVAAWEWARLDTAPRIAPASTPGAPAAPAPGKPAPVALGMGGPVALLTGAGVLVAGGLMLAWRQSAEWPRPVLIGLCVVLVAWWIAVGGWRLRQVRAGRSVVVAALLLLGCWVALYELRVLGPLALLSSMAVVWVADVAAYFFGRALGRRKLAPRISPGKSWEGAVGGFFSVAIIGLGAGAAPFLADSLPGLLVARWSPLVAALVLVAIAALSIVGDLHESLLKRQVGAKDSSRLLPGHGGVLDRVDALIPTMPACLLLFLLLR